ncbi:MAG: ribbon-helix-helix protein, CopG family [Sphaerochaetaceae bacterium]
MSNLIRFGVSMEKELVTLLDKYTEKRQFPNRSETIRSLVREKLIKEDTDNLSVATATVSLIFDYRTKLNKVVIFNSLKILANLQMHLDKEMVIKILVVSGIKEEIKKWSDELLSQKNVVGNVTVVATDSLYGSLKNG